MPSARAPFKAPAHSVYTCVGLRLLLSGDRGAAAGAVAPSTRPAPALKNKSSPDERTARTQRSRRRNVHLALCRAERHVGGVGAREAASRKPDENSHEKQERGAVRVRVARACDEEDFRDCVTGEDMGCGREDNLVSASPGRGGFGKWGRLFGRVSVRRLTTSKDWYPRPLVRTGTQDYL